MQREGEDVILLSVGDPDFRTPEPIIDNAVSYLRVGRTHYSPALGELKLRRAVADLESATSPFPCGVDEVAIFPGATAAIHAVMSLPPRCRVTRWSSRSPCTWATCRSCARWMRQRAHVPLRVATDFASTVEAVKAAISERTRVVFINTPGNPDRGSIIPRAQLRELAAYCLRARDLAGLRRGVLDVRLRGRTCPPGPVRTASTTS
jgi:arginine:pyruvate transaminase